MKFDEAISAMLETLADKGVLIKKTAGDARVILPLLAPGFRLQANSSWPEMLKAAKAAGRLFGTDAGLIALLAAKFRNAATLLSGTGAIPTGERAGHQEWTLAKELGRKEFSSWADLGLDGQQMAAALLGENSASSDPTAADQSSVSDEEQRKLFQASVTFRVHFRQNNQSFQSQVQ